MKKKIIIAGIILAAATVSAAVCLLLSRYTGRISYSGTVSADVVSPIVLERDVSGIPLVQARNYRDVCFGLGFLHAQDRYALMEYFRAIASAHSGDLAGNDGPALDRLSRAVGFMTRAREIFQRIRDPYSGYLAAYADGVNAARKHLSLKDAVPREWSPEDCVAILLLREWANAYLNNGEIIFPFPRDDTIASLKEVVPEDLIYYYSESESDCIDVVRKIKKLLEQRVGPFDRGFAFYMPAEAIKEKFPVTAFSFDGSLSLYPEWYPVHINTEDRIIKGVTCAGMPFIFAGSNIDIAFLGFSVNADAQDFIAEEIVKTGETYQYRGPTGWRDFDIVRDGEGSGGGGRIRATANGPVLNDVFETAEYGSSVATIKSVFFGEDYIASLFDIPVSKSIEEAGALVRNIRSFPRVYLFASDDAALRVWSGTMPVRNRSDSVLRTGLGFLWNGMLDLSGYRERGGRPMTAGSSFLDDAPVPVRENAVHDSGRYDRLKSILARRKRFTNRDIEGILSDTRSRSAEQFLPVFLSILGDNPVASARLTRIYFQNWKCDMDIDSVAPSVFYALLQNFMRETFRDELGDRVEDVMDQWEMLVPRFYEAVRENRSPIFDDRATYPVERRDTIFDRAFLKTVRFLNRTRGPVMDKWTWGDIHSGRYLIPGRGGEIQDDRIADDPFAGGADTLQLGSPGLTLKPDEVTSLSGYFGVEQSFIFMNYTYSTDPRSEFYYGTQKRLGASSFHDVYGDYFTRIVPLKKK
ncbi:MAG: hypothetical protein A2176_03470 [Spirochaetes bacterium RBG_13_51_14]|nr:MAG: hypothetical protein A2176_03470 [Spirochaetes bacterium RBG_13_51_14]